MINVFGLKISPLNLSIRERSISFIVKALKLSHMKAFLPTMSRFKGVYGPYVVHAIIVLILTSYLFHIVQ